MNGTSIHPENKIQKKELLTVKEVAIFLRVGRVTVWRWCKDGIIPAYRVGRVWRIPRVDLMNFLESSKLSDFEPNTHITPPDDVNQNNQSTPDETQENSLPLPAVDDNAEEICEEIEANPDSSTIMELCN